MDYEKNMMQKILETISLCLPRPSKYLNEMVKVLTFIGKTVKTRFLWVLGGSTKRDMENSMKIPWFFLWFLTQLQLYFHGGSL